MDIPPKSPPPSVSSGEGALGYLDTIVKNSFGHEERIKVPIPPQGLHEPKATTKQKEQLIELGITKPEVVQNLGSGQAGYIIDQILVAREQNRSGRRGASSSALILGAVVAAMIGGAFVIFRGAGNDSTPAASSNPRNPPATSTSTSPRFTSAASEPSARIAIPGLSPQKLYDMLELQERGFSFEPPEPPSTGNWLFKLLIDGKTYQITAHGSNSHSVEWVEVKIDVMQGYDINELTQSFFGSVASMGSTSESALAAQKWVKEHINKNGAATFGALDFEITSDSPRQRKLIISASKSPHLDPDIPPEKPPK